MSPTTSRRTLSRSLLPVACRSLRSLRSAVCRSLLPIAYCLLPAVPALAQDDGVLLRFNYEESETLVYHTTLTGAGSIKVLGQDQPINLEGSLDSILQVESVDADGNYTVLSSYDNVDVSVKVSNQPMDVPLALPTLRFVMTPAGAVSDVAHVAEEEAGQAGQGMAGMIASSLNLESLLEGIKLAPFPEDAVKPGDEWDAAVPVLATADDDDTREVKLHAQYVGNEELLGHQCVKLASTSEMPLGGAGGEAGIFTLEGTSTTQAVVWFDPDAGRVIANTATTNLEITLGPLVALPGGQEQVPVFAEIVADTETTLVAPENQ